MLFGIQLKNQPMGNKTDHHKELKELQDKSIAKFNEYISSKKTLKKGTHEKLQQQRDKWQDAWNELMETLLTLERIEI
jgi:hypothetical protein